MEPEPEEWIRAGRSMKRRTLLTMGTLGAAGLATYAWWGREPSAPIDRLRLSAEQSRQSVPAEVGTELWAVLHIDIDEGPDQERPPVHVGLVIDTSASMQGAPIQAARQAATELIDALRDGDRLSVVTFDSKAALIVPNAELDDDVREQAREAVAAIEARGTTDLAGGLEMVLSDISPYVAEGRLTRVVLLSDGVPNEDANIPSLAARASAQGITVTALGFGLDYDETLLGSIAQQTGGTFHFLQEPAALVALFRDENRRLQGVEAKEIVLSLTTGPNVELMEVVGHTFALPQPRLQLGLGDLSQGEQRVVVVRLAVGPHRSGAIVELLDAAVQYVDPRTGASVDHHAVFLSAGAADDAAVLAETLDPAIEREIERAKAAAFTLQAVSLTRDGNVGQARDVLVDAMPVAVEVANRLDDPQLLEQAGEMEELAQSLEDAPAEGSEGAGVAAGKPRMAESRRKSAVRQAHGNAMSNFQARSQPREP